MNGFETSAEHERIAVGLLCKGYKRSLGLGKEEFGRMIGILEMIKWKLAKSPSFLLEFDWESRAEQGFLHFFGFKVRLEGF